MARHRLLDALSLWVVCVVLRHPQSTLNQAELETCQFT